MEMRLIILLALLCLTIPDVCCRKTSKSRSRGGSGSSRKTNANPQPAPTSFSNPQPAQQKPSLSGWQQAPVKQKSHSYPQSNTGNQASHSYPASTGLSGKPASGAGYPQQAGGGLSGAGKGAGSAGASYPPAQGGGLSGAAPASSGANPQHQGSLAGATHTGSGYPQSAGGLSGGTHTGAGAGYPHPSGAHNPQHNNAQGNNYQHPQGPPPPYPGQGGAGYGGHGYGGQGYGAQGYGAPGHYNPGYGQQSPGYFGNSYGGGYGGVGRSRGMMTGMGIAGAGVGVGTILTGLALWNLARSTGRQHHTVIYDNRGQPVAVAPDNSTEPVVDPILGDLVNCTLTIDNGNATDVLAIPCSIATSFSPEAEASKVGAEGATDNTKCTITVVTKAGQEYLTTIPCSILLNTAAENNVTEPPLTAGETNTPLLQEESSNQNQTIVTQLPVNATGEYNTTLECTPEPGDVRDPINPCYAVVSDLTVIPIGEDSVTTPIAA